MSHRAPRSAGDVVRFRAPGPDHLIVVDAWVNGAGPFGFVVDTGASMTVIGPAVARSAGLPAGGRAAKAVGAIGRLDARVVQLKSLRIGGVEIKKLRAAVVSLGALNRSTAYRIGGIIGYNVLRRYRFTIDYSRRSILLRPCL